MCLCACVLRHKLSCCNVLSVWLLIKAEICGLVSLSLPPFPRYLFRFFLLLLSSLDHTLAFFFSFSEPPLFGCLPVWQLQSTVDTHLSKRTELGHAWGRGVARGGEGRGGGWVESAATCTQLVERFQRSFRHRQWQQRQLRQLICQMPNDNPKSIKSCFRLLPATLSLESSCSPSFSASCPRAR